MATSESSSKMTIILNHYWRFLILALAIVSQILIFYWPQTNLENLDVESAVKRAKTDSCKRELLEFSNISQNTLIHLKRRCSRDSKRQRILKVGCALNSTESFTKIEDRLANSSHCLEVCFNYGHSHGGYNVASKSCFCGDDALLKVSGHDVQCYGQDWMDWYQIDNGIYKPNKLKGSTIDRSNGTNQLRIAFLLTLSGRNVIQVKRLLKNIYSPKHVYYLHVDKRDDYMFNSLRKLANNHKNIILTESRFNTIWGGPSLLRMLVDAIGRLSTHEWDYLINLSESDFPIKPLRDLEIYLSIDTRLIYLKSHNIKGYNFIKKQGLDRNFYQCEDRVWRLGKRFLPTGIVYSGGSDWFALPRDFCIYIARYRESDLDSLVSPLLKIYNNTLLPAESFFHTLALNSEFCDRFVDKNLRVTNWHRQKGCKCQHQDVVDWCGCSPHVYRLADEQKLKQAKLHRDLFFARKFDHTISSRIVNALEYSINRNFDDHFEVNFSDTRHWLNIYDKSENFDPNRDHVYIMRQFGQFALNQTKRQTQQELQSIHAYFNQDRYIGLIFHYCRKFECVQLLVERQTRTHLRHYNTDCAKSLGFRLNAIEVNHGFDTGERMFRDYRPISDMSDIVVYHEWFLTDLAKMRKNSTDGIRFSWINPRGSLELAQKVKFKPSNKPIRVSLAHRLASTKPLLSGLWTLLISEQNRHCFEYKFLIFHKTSFKKNEVTQKQFDRFYQVTKICSINDTNSADISCAHQLWPISDNITITNKIILQA